MKKLAPFVVFSILSLLALNARASSFSGSNGFITANNPANGLTGAAAPTSATLVGGTDGTNIRALSVDSTGKQNILNISGTVSLPTGAATQATLAAILAEFPASIGQKTMAGSLACTLASDQSSIPVTGSFFQATQPVSAVSLPLPTGASTEATLSALNTKVTAVNTGAVVVSSSALPTGASTEATLSSLNGKVTAVNTGAVVVSSSALPSGASTSAAQTTAQTSLTSIDGKITAVNTGAVVVSSSALPSGAATSSNQGTANISLATIATNSSKVPINITGSGSGAAATVSTVATLSAPANAVGFILMNLDTSTTNMRWAVGRTASTTLGQQLQPGRDTGFVPIGNNISIIAESGTVTYDVQWVSQ